MGSTVILPSGRTAAVKFGLHSVSLSMGNGLNGRVRVRDNVYLPKISVGRW